MKYLRVSPTSRPKKTDYVMLAKSWTSRAFSYAERLQLINSILFAMQVY
jgi:hypothetical protein